MTRLPLIVVLALAACGPTPKNFAENFNEVDCKRFEECAKGAFDMLYSSVEDCVARRADDSDTLAECFAGHCEFDKKNAAQCLDDIAGADCDEIVDASAYADCADVWTECDADAAIECIVDGGETDDTAGS